MFLDEKSLISALKNLSLQVVGPDFWRNLLFFVQKQTLPLHVPHDLPMFRVHNNLCVALYNGGGGRGSGGSHNIPKI